MTQFPNGRDHGAYQTTTKKPYGAYYKSGQWGDFLSDAEDVLFDVTDTADATFDEIDTADATFDIIDTADAVYCRPPIANNITYDRSDAEDVEPT